MFAFKRFSPYFKFASKSEVSCRERKRIHPFNRDIFIQNMEAISDMILKTDIKFSNLVAHNFVHFAIEHDDFADLIMNNIKYRLNDLTPDVIYDLVHNFRELADFEHADMMDLVFNYLQENWFMFTARQIESMERIYYAANKKVAFGTNPFFGEILEIRKNNLKLDSHANADKIFEALEIDVPKDKLHIQIQPEDKIIRIRFKDIDKQVTIKGLGKGWDPILQARALIDKKHPDFIFMEMAPLTQHDIVEKKSSERETVLNRFIGEDPAKPDNRQRHNLLSLFDKYDKLPIIDSEFFSWYVEKILKNEKIYRINESERTVYKHSQGLEVPDEKASILYSISKSKNKSNIKVLLTDMSPFDEINLMANKKTVAQVKELFEYGRYMMLNEQLRWGLKVNRSGCPMCSKSHKESYLENLELFSHKRRAFDLREPFIARQIVKGVYNFQHYNNYMAFVDEDHVFTILQHICKIFSEEEMSFPEKKSEDEIFLSLLCEKELSPAVKLKNSGSQEDHANKFAMLAALFYGNKPINIPTGSALDLQLYFSLKAEYNRLLTLNSFINSEANQWKKYKQEDRCFAVNSLFHGDTLKSF